MQWVDPVSGMHAWFAPPRFVVMQFPGPLFSAAGARASVRAMDEVVQALGARRIRALGGLVMMNDVRRCTQTEPEAQAIIKQAWRGPTAQLLEEGWVFKSDIPAFALMMLRMINRVASLAGRVQHVVDDPGPVLLKLGVSRPPDGFRFPSAAPLAAGAE